jgi:hypothetical protein
MTAPAASTPAASTPEQEMLRRRMEALTGPDIRLNDWEDGFVSDVCWRGAGGLTPRQEATIALICWRKRDQLPPDLAPSKEPRLPKRQERR